MIVSYKELSEDFYKGKMYCHAGKHSYKVMLPVRVALKYVGLSAPCQKHGGGWKEKTTALYSHNIELVWPKR